MKKTLHQLVGRQIADECRARGLTQQVVAKHLGITQAGVSLIYLGKRRISLDTLEAVAGMFGLDTGDFLNAALVKASRRPKAVFKKSQASSLKLDSPGAAK